ncbi:MAG: hypothetical protein WAL52_14615, partial [Candidatus Sulfotelmatobacter sp.]
PPSSIAIPLLDHPRRICAKIRCARSSPLVAFTRTTFLSVLSYRRCDHVPPSVALAQIKFKQVKFEAKPEVMSEAIL